MNARICLAALIGIFAGLYSYGHEVLVSRENQRIERWSVSDDGSKWEKRGDFLVAGKDVQPTGLSRPYGTQDVKEACRGARAVILCVTGAPQQLQYRSLLYTAVTRARELLIAIGDETILRQMIDNQKQARRYSGLRARLAGEIG